MGCEAEASLPFVFFVVRPRMQILNACLRLCPCVSRVVFFFFPLPFYMCVSIAGLVEQRGLAASLSTGVCDLRAWCEHFSHSPA